MTENISALLDAYRRTVPVNVEGLAAALGVKVQKDASLQGGISGHIKRAPSGRYSIAAAAGEAKVRQRFTIAHELGHYILHRSILEQTGGTNDTTMYRTSTDGVAFNPGIMEVHERQANSFAANLLMPSDKVREEWKIIGDVSRMADKFQVSLSAMKWRLHNLGLHSAK